MKSLFLKNNKKLGQIILQHEYRNSKNSFTIIMNMGTIYMYVPWWFAHYYLTLFIASRSNLKIGRRYFHLLESGEDINEFQMYLKTCNYIKIVSAPYHKIQKLVTTSLQSKSKSVMYYMQLLNSGYRLDADIDARVN